MGFSLHLKCLVVGYSTLVGIAFMMVVEIMGALLTLEGRELVIQSLSQIT
jgi:hypothetical protein